MANTLNKIIDLQALTDYTAALKTYISTQAGAAAAIALKSAAYDTSTEKLLFYKEEPAKVVPGTTTPAFSFDYKKIATTGAAADVSISDADGIITATTVEGALAEIKKLVDTLNASDTTTGSVAKAVKDLKDSLDYTDAAVANQFVTAVSETDGVISVTRAALVEADIPTLKMSKISDAGTAAKVNVATAAISDSSTDTSLVTSEQVAKYVKDKTASLTGAMHFTFSVTPQSGETDVQAIDAAYTAASKTPEKGDFVVITTNTKEYVFDGTAWVELGDNSLYVTKATTIAGVDLQDPITKTELLKAINVSDGAQVNVLEGVQVNGSDLTVDSNKKVNVTIATGKTEGTIAVNGTDVAVAGIGFATKTEVEALFA